MSIDNKTFQAMQGTKLDRAARATWEIHEGRHIRNRHGGPVCELTSTHDPTRRKNARLIAAAPDTATALRDLFEHCVMVHKHWGEDSNQKQADAAIAAGRAALDLLGEGVGNEAL